MATCAMRNRKTGMTTELSPGIKPQSGRLHQACQLLHVTPGGRIPRLPGSSRRYLPYRQPCQSPLRRSA
jgi:hypothetical protein